MTSKTLNNLVGIENIDTGIKKDGLVHVVQSLCQVMASSYTLMLKSQAFHWNVTGPHFYSLHNLSETHYSDLFEALDVYAERIRALGHVPPTSYAQLAKFSCLGEFEEKHTSQEMLQILLADHEKLSRILHEACAICEEAGDIVTLDLYTQRAAFHEKAAWMLRATLA